MDKLLIYLGENLVINDKITVYQPSILDIARFGEKHYFNIINRMCSIPSDYKSELWDMGLNYGKIDDFELFILLTRDMDNEDTKLILGNDVSLKDMEPVIDTTTQEIMLLDKERGTLITHEIYDEMIAFIRDIHNIHPKRERAANKETLRLLIDEDRTKKASKAKESGSDSFLLPLISSMINSPGFKYDINSLKNLGIYAFLDSVQRIQVINTATSISNGMYSGMVDLSKNPNLLKQLNWLRDLSNEGSSSGNVRVTKTDQ